MCFNCFDNTNIAQICDISKYFCIFFQILPGPLQGQDDEYICTVNIWDAIHEMRRLSEKGISFSFTFMSCNLTDGTSDGVIEVMHGRLLSREVERHHKNADYVERYLNLDTMKARRFYQPLLMTFNGEKVTV